jgi:prolyl oligopeptidase
MEIASGRTVWLLGLCMGGCTPVGPAPASEGPGSSVSPPPPVEHAGPPPTRRTDTVDELHGERVPDPYRWLEAERDPEVQTWMKRQNAWARRHLDALPGREALRERLEALSYVDSESPPVRRGPWLFYSRRHADKEKVVYYVRRGDDGPERVLLDPNEMSDDGRIAVKGLSPSLDGRLVAYKVSHNNADAATMFVREVETGKDSAIDVIEGARYAWASWLPDGSGFYYTALPVDSEIPPSELPGHAEIRFHRIGEDPANDAVVHPALHDPKTFIGAYASRDGHWLILTISRGFDSTDVYYRDLRRPAIRVEAAVGEARTLAAGFRPLVVGTPARSSVSVWRDRFYLHTNDGAPRFRLFAVDPREPRREGWREIVPERDATLEDVTVVGEHLVLSYLDKASSRLEVRTLGGDAVREVELPQIGSASGMIGNPDEDEAYFYFSSFVQVPQIYKTSIRTGQTELWSEIDVPVDTSAMTVEQVWYASKDGTPISMFVVHRKDIELDGGNPTLLTGYGGFSVSMTPDFSAGVVLWVERGGVWAVPNLRGGGEYGEAWHEAGKGPNKQNTFDDFIAAAEYLVDRGYTRPAKLAIRGGSNGGLLVGAASTQRPDLFGAVVCAVPLLDMIRYHLFGSGQTWISEYGSAEDPEAFRTLWAYSPYHRIRSEATYPPLLMLAADSDDRVDPMHARKYVAAMQHVASDVPILLRIEEGAGHGGADLIRQAVEQAVDTYAFLIDRLAGT